MARRLEASRQVYPYKWEDWLRYLLPTLWPQDSVPGLMLTGPSTARENLLVEDFAAAFPNHRVMPGAMSLGTFRDITAGLEYVEAEYGRAALPARIVLGISPRFIAEIPPDRPFPTALARYSRHWGPLVDSSAAFGLARKPAAVGATDHLRFRASRQSPRYRAVLAWTVAEVIPEEMNSRLAGSWPARALAESRVGRLLGVQQLAREGPREFARQYVSPYRYQPIHVPWTPEQLTTVLGDTGSWWADVLRWDPDRDAAAIRERARALGRFAAERGIALYVVSLPEHSALRERVNPVFAARYDLLIRSAFDFAPLLDLRCFLPDADFLDAEHAMWNGARKISARVIGFMKAVDAARVGSGGDHETVMDVSDQWSRGSCAQQP